MTPLTSTKILIKTKNSFFVYTTSIKSRLNHIFKHIMTITSDNNQNSWHSACHTFLSTFLISLSNNIITMSKNLTKNQECQMLVWIVVWTHNCTPYSTACCNNSFAHNHVIIYHTLLARKILCLDPCTFVFSCFDYFQFLVRDWYSRCSKQKKCLQETCLQSCIFSFDVWISFHHINHSMIFCLSFSSPWKQQSSIQNAHCGNDFFHDLIELLKWNT